MKTNSYSNTSVLAVKSLEEAIPFYENVLGLKAMQ